MNIFKHINFNIFGLIIMVVMMTPNVLFMFLKKGDKPTYKPTMLLNVVEQVGRYGSMLLMIVMVSYQEVSEQREILNIILSAMLTVLYIWSWRVYFFKESKSLRMALSIFPTLIFISNGVLTYSIPLLVTGILFGIGHILITSKSN